MLFQYTGVKTQIAQNLYARPQKKVENHEKGKGGIYTSQTGKKKYTLYGWSRNNAEEKKR